MDWSVLKKVYFPSDNKIVYVPEKCIKDIPFKYLAVGQRVETVPNYPFVNFSGVITDIDIPSDIGTVVVFVDIDDEVGIFQISPKYIQHEGAAGRFKVGDLVQTTPDFVKINDLWMKGKIVSTFGEIARIKSKSGDSRIICYRYLEHVK